MHCCWTNWHACHVIVHKTQEPIMRRKQIALISRRPALYYALSVFMRSAICRPWKRDREWVRERVKRGAVVSWNNRRSLPTCRASPLCQLTAAAAVTMTPASSAPAAATTPEVTDVNISIRYPPLFHVDSADVRQGFASIDLFKGKQMSQTLSTFRQQLKSRLFRK